MTNPPRKKGTAAETAVVNWLRANGFGGADRQPLRGRDQGDITACPGVIIEVKDHKRVAGGIPPAVLTEWMRQTEAERCNADADLGILVVKRSGTADPGRWYAYVPLWVVRPTALTPREAPVCMSLADLVVLLRSHGWGDALDDGGTA